MSRKSLGTLTLDLVARTGGFVQGMSKAERESRRWRRQVERDLKKVGADLQKTAKIAAGVVTAGGAAIAAMTKKGLDAISAQATLARSLDTTFDSVTALQLAFSDAGIDNFEASVNRLNRRLGAAELGRGAALQAVKELKLDLQELANVEADERLAIIADRIQEVSDNSQVAARYAQDLGFEQREAAQFFMQGGDAIRTYRKEVDDFGLALSAIDAAKVELATVEFQRTGRIFTAINQQLAVQVAPLLGSISGLLLDTARDAGGMGDAIESVFDRAVIAGINTASSVRSVFNQIQDSVEDVWSGFQALPPWAQEVGIAGALIGGKKGILVVAALSKAAEDTRVTAAWFAALTEGDIGFYEWLTAGNAQAKERLKELGHDIDEIKTKAEGPSIIGSLFGPREDGDEWADEMIARYRRLQDEAKSSAEDALQAQQAMRNALSSAGVDRQQADQLEWIAAVEDRVAAARRSWDISVLGIGMGDKAREQLEELTRIADEYAKRREKLARAQGTADALPDEVFQARIAALRRAQDEEVAIVIDGTRRKEEAEADWTKGANRAWENYLDSARNIASQTDDLFTTAFGSMEDAIVEFATKGKLSFRDFALSVIEDISRIAARQAATGILNIGISAVAGAFSGGVAQAKGGAWDDGLQKFAKGGVFTNQVVDRPTLFPFARGTGLMGEAGPEAIMPLKRGADGTLGVMAVGGIGKEASINVVVNIDSSGNAAVSSDRAGIDQFGAELGRFIEQKYRQLISRDLADGGQIKRAMAGGYR